MREWHDEIDFLGQLLGLQREDHDGGKLRQLQVQPTFQGKGINAPSCVWGGSGPLVGKEGPSLRLSVTCALPFPFAFIYFSSLVVRNRHRPFACELQTQPGMLTLCCIQNSPYLAGLWV